MLVGLVGDDSPRVCVAGCCALSALTQLSLAKEQLGHEDVGGLSALVSLLTQDSLEQEGEVKESALSALCEATLDSSQNKSKLCVDLRGLEVLVPLLSHPHCPVQTQAAAVLENFSLMEGYRLEILQLGAVRILVEELSSSDKKVVSPTNPWLLLIDSLIGSRRLLQTSGLSLHRAAHSHALNINSGISEAGSAVSGPRG